jgi:hypothetical protein
MAVRARKKKNAPTPKEAVRGLLEQMPDDVTYQDIQYHIHVREKIELGLQAAERGEVISQEEVEARIERWLEE